MESVGRSSGRQRHRWHAAAKSIYGSSGANCRSCPELPLLRTWRGHSHRDITSPYYILISRSLAGVAGGGRPRWSHDCQLKFNRVVQGDSTWELGTWRSVILYRVNQVQLHRGCLQLVRLSLLEILSRSEMPHALCDNCSCRTKVHRLHK